MKYMRLITGLFLVLSLLGCTDFDGSIKKNLQAEYDRMNKTGNQAFCYLAGRTQFPYTEGPLNEDADRYDKSSARILAKRLPVFVEVGLLAREPVAEGSPYYRYSLTPEGEKYLYFEAGNGYNIPDASYFCYGRRVILKVTDIVDSKAANGEYMFTEIEYDNQIEGVPEWPRDDRLMKLYQQATKIYEGQTYEDSGRVKKQGGAYYNAGGIGRQRIGYY